MRVMRVLMIPRMRGIVEYSDLINTALSKISMDDIITVELTPETASFEEKAVIIYMVDQPEESEDANL